MDIKEFISTLPKEVLVSILTKMFAYRDLEYIKHEVKSAMLDINLSKQHEILKEIGKINTNEKDLIKFIENHKKIEKLYKDIKVLDDEFNRLTNELYPKEK